MSTDLPEGVTRVDVRRHAQVLGIAATLINMSGAYLTANEGSPEERAAENTLNDFIENVLHLGSEMCGNVLLAMASMVTQTGDEATVQAWFDDQAVNIKAALDG